MEIIFCYTINSLIGDDHNKLRFFMIILFYHLFVTGVKIFFIFLKSKISNIFGGGGEGVKGVISQIGDFHNLPPE